MARPRSTRWQDRAFGVALVFFGPVLLAINLWASTASIDIVKLGAWRRLWSDLAQATASWVESTEAPAPPEVTGTAAVDVARGLIIERVANQGLTPRRPLEIVRKTAPFVEARIKPEGLPYDDQGRAVVLGLAFRARGGIAPFLVFWLAFLVAAPALAWTTLEFKAAARTRMAALAPLLLGLSPYLADALALGRYAVGFYLSGVLLILPLSVYARLHPAPSVRGLFLRVALASALLSLCVFCRSSAGVLVPGFALAVWFGAGRVSRTLGRRLGLTAAATILLALPTILVPGAQQNDMWQPVWEGLGDFDRSHGFTWADKTALENVQRAGVPSLWTPESERVLRDQVINAVKAEPLWFGGILVRRLLSTVSLWRLWPWTPLDGDFLRRAQSPNEGVIDKYWTYTTTADFMGIGDFAFELPVLILLTPMLVLAALAWRGKRAKIAREALLLLACPALATVILPVLITTAGGQEGQAFALVHLLAGAFLIDLLCTRTHDDGKTLGAEVVHGTADERHRQESDRGSTPTSDRIAAAPADLRLAYIRVDPVPDRVLRSRAMSVSPRVGVRVR